MFGYSGATLYTVLLTGSKRIINTSNVIFDEREVLLKNHVVPQIPVLVDSVRVECTEHTTPPPDDVEPRRQPAVQSAPQRYDQPPPQKRVRIDFTARADVGEFLDLLDRDLLADSESASADDSGPDAPSTLIGNSTPSMLTPAGSLTSPRLRYSTLSPDLPLGNTY